MLHLGSIGGTTIRVDFSFFILVGLWVGTAYNPKLGIEYALLWVPVLFISVLIHELAHAATIASFGYGASEIVLGGIGGVTMNQRKARPWHDTLISLAGPLSSFALAFAFGRLEYAEFVGTDKMLVHLVPMLTRMNVLWGFFNLLPVSPLDGGHALRNFLRIFLSEKTAFLIAVWVAILVGIVVVILGLKTGLYFVAVLIGWYAYTNYQQWQYFREHGYPGD